jgi:hypothetical protein
MSARLPAAVTETGRVGEGDWAICAEANGAQINKVRADRDRIIREKRFERAFIDNDSA